MDQVDPLPVQQSRQTQWSPRISQPPAVQVVTDDASCRQLTGERTIVAIADGSERYGSPLVRETAQERGGHPFSAAGRQTAQQHQGPHQNVTAAVSACSSMRWQ